MTGSYSWSHECMSHDLHNVKQLSVLDSQLRPPCRALLNRRDTSVMIQHKMLCILTPCYLCSCTELPDGGSHA